jgi:glutamine amidotransferase-like uncharacterized protein
LKSFQRSFVSVFVISAALSGCNQLSEAVPTSVTQQPISAAPVSTSPTATTPAPVPVAPPVATVPAPVPTNRAQPIALVYGGPGVLTGPDDTLVRAKFVAAAAGFKVVEVDEPVDPAVLNSASVWIQPGGPNLSADSFMNRNGMADQVRDFVTRGGGYVGFCGGAFSAINNLGLIPGSAWNLKQATEKVPVTWLGKVRYIHFEDGPYLVLTDKSTEVVGTYANGDVAVARGHYGKGEVFISGVHPEAGPDWTPTYDPDGPDTDLAVSMIQEVAAIPSPESTPSP